AGSCTAFPTACCCGERLGGGQRGGCGARAAGRDRSSETEDQMSYPPVFKYAAASPAVTALLGSNRPRVYMFGMAPQNVAYPYAVWQMVGGAPENYLTNTPNIDAFTTQIDVYATTANAARACAMALRDAFEPYGHVT